MEVGATAREMRYGGVIEANSGPSQERSLVNEVKAPLTDKHRHYKFHPAFADNDLFSLLLPHPHSSRLRHQSSDADATMSSFTAVNARAAPHTSPIPS